MNSVNSDRVRFGPYEADLHTHELWKFGIKVKLVGQPFEVLAILLSRPGGLVTREELRDRLWPGDTFVDFNHGLNAAVNRLREALCDSADDPKYVETLPRRGYRFIALIETAAAGRAAVPSESDVRAKEILTAPSPVVVLPVAPQFVPERVAVLPRYGMPLSWRIALASGTLVVVVGILLLGWMVRKRILAGAEAEAGNSEAWKRIQPLTTLTDGTNHPAISADGNFVAFRREGAKEENSGIFVKALAGDQLLQLTANPRDGFPVWSPDGQSVAFSRRNGEVAWDLFVVPLARGQARVLYKNEQQMTITVGGEEERKIDTGDVKPTRGELDWSPDGKLIAFVNRGSIYLLSLADRTTRRFTDPPPPLSEDWGPSLSPDGTRLLFVRETRDAATAEITVISVTGGDPRQVLADPAGIVGTPRWSADGKSVIFGSSRGSHAGLWRTAVDSREQAVEINDAGWFPSISRRGYRMAYQRAMRGLNIWELDLGSKGSEQRILVPSTSQTDQGPGPQFSPDGKKLAYMSDRSGTMEIWASDRDGSNPVQLTALGGAGTPRWSPDSQWVAFDRRGAIYVVSAMGGAPRLVADDQNENDCPSWSVDGKWVYFASARTHDFHVWKAPAEGGAAVQVTRQGGHAPLASPDGKFIYYAKSQYADPEIWHVPVDGGVEMEVSPLVHPATWASWVVVNRGILFAGALGKGPPVVSLYDFETRRVSALGTLKIAPFWLGATADGKVVVFDQPGSEQDQVMLVENFR
jgi:Tol biopolymer transport system component/DNA-binding winged helix-turn-helix (wHTH) protein